MVEARWSSGVDSTAEETRKYDVIFMDSIMPVLGGIDATRQIRNLGVKVPIYGVTGNGLAEDILAFKKGGVDEVYIKPVDANTIREIIEGTYYDP